MKKIEDEESEKIMNAVLNCRDSIIKSFKMMSNYIDESLNELERLVSCLQHQQICASRLEAIEESIKYPKNYNQKYSNDKKTTNSKTKEIESKQAQTTNKKDNLKEQSVSIPNKQNNKEKRTTSPIIIKKKEKNDNQNIAPRNTLNEEDTAIKLPKLTQKDIERIERLKNILNGPMIVSDHLKNYVVPSSFSSEEFYNKAMKYINEN